VLVKIGMSGVEHHGDPLLAERQRHDAGATEQRTEESGLHRRG
jgi:hypothetical protein